MIILQILLFPFAVLYNLITAARNRTYDQGIKPSMRFDVPVIGVGNLTVGGTGKTPLTEYLIRLLSVDNRVATLSRGYGRKTKGFRMAQSSDNATTIGDEPFQIFQKFGGNISVAVGEDRAYAIPLILQEYPETGVILLDDAYQHRSVTPSLNILLSDYYRPFYTDLLLPAGRLRESRRGACRADLIVVTKCSPDLSDATMMEIKASIRRYSDAPVYFSTVRYGSPVPFRSGDSLNRDVVLVTGIAASGPLEEYVSQHFHLVRHFKFSDHHAYTIADLKMLGRFVKSNPGVSILTTEKDKAKLGSDEFTTYLEDLPFFSLPIALEFLKSGKEFDERVLNDLRRDG